MPASPARTGLRLAPRRKTATFLAALLASTTAPGFSTLADINTTGDVDPVYNGTAPWNVAALQIGKTASGTMTVYGGSYRVSDVDVDGTLGIGVQSAGVGNLFLSGRFTKVSSGLATVGVRGSASVHIADGANLEVEDGAFTIAEQAGSSGEVRITGRDSSVYVSNRQESLSADVYVGKAGDGQLVIEDRGTLSLRGDLYIGHESGSTGEVLINDVGGRLFHPDSYAIHVGVDGTGTLRLNHSSGHVATSMHVGSQGGTGSVYITGTELGVDRLSLGSESGTGYVEVGSGGSLQIGSDGYTIQPGSQLILDQGHVQTASDTDLSMPGLQFVSGTLQQTSGSVTNGTIGEGQAIEIDGGNVGSGVTLDGGTVILNRHAELQALPFEFNSGTLQQHQQTLSNGTINAGQTIEVIRGGKVGTGVTLDGGTLTYSGDLDVQATQFALNSGTLNTGGLLASEDSLKGVGTINAKSIVSDWDMLLNSSTGAQQQIILDSLPDQNVTLNYANDQPRWVDDFFGAGYSETATVTVSEGVTIDTSYGYLGYTPGANGTVTLSGEGTRWDNRRLFVGREGQGTLNILDGAIVTTRDAYVGERHGSKGTVTIDGEGSEWIHSTSLSLGFSGEGTLNIQNGGTARLHELRVGIGAPATVNVVGEGSQLLMTSHRALSVGRQNPGELNILEGGAVSMFDDLQVGGRKGSRGTVLVSGAGSTLSVDRFYAGVEGIGVLTVREGAILTSTNRVDFGIRSASKGTATIDGIGSKWNSLGYAYIGGAGIADVYVQNQGEVNLTQGATIGSRGTIHVEGGILDLHGYDLEVVEGGQVNFVSGQITGLNEMSIQNLGIVNLTSGTLDFDNRALVISQGGQFNFSGGTLTDVSQINSDDSFTQSGGTLAPGNSPGLLVINGGYALDRGDLEIELEGRAIAGEDYDQLQVLGEVDLLGEDGLANAELELILGFEAEVGDSFTILDNDGSDSVLGTFAQGSSITADYDGYTYEFAIDYAAGTGNDVALTVNRIVPEPGTLAVFALAGLSVSARRRRAA